MIRNIENQNRNPVSDAKIDEILSEIRDRKRIFPSTNCLGCQSFLFEGLPIPGIHEVPEVSTIIS